MTDEILPLPSSSYPLVWLCSSPTVTPSQPFGLSHHFPDLSVQVLTLSTTHTTTATPSSELHGDSPTNLQSPCSPLCSHLPPGHAGLCHQVPAPLVMLPKTIAGVVGLKSSLGVLKSQGLDNVPKGQEIWWSLLCSPTAASNTSFGGEIFKRECERKSLMPDCTAFPECHSDTT